LLRKEKPEIIILNFSADVKTVGTAAWLAQIGNIVYRRGSAIPIRNTVLNRFLFKRVITRVIANSRETKNTILQNNNTLFPEENIRVIYNGIDITKFDGVPTADLYQRKGDEVIIGNAGRLSQEKGQKFLIEMASILEKHKILFRILIAGEGALEPALKNMARQAGVEEKVSFLGFINNMKAFMENIDIFVLPSLWEGFGFVTIEAMACEKPVVAFNIGSNPEIIADRETGFLIDPFDINDFTQKVEFLMVDPYLRRSFGQAGRSRVKEVFDLRGSEKETEQFLMSL
jgi:glycosyltransferase involved in cell wall biosynthesis